MAVPGLSAIIDMSLPPFRATDDVGQSPRYYRLCSEIGHRDEAV